MMFKKPRGLIVDEDRPPPSVGPPKENQPQNESSSTPEQPRQRGGTTTIISHGSYDSDDTGMIFPARNLDSDESFSESPENWEAIFYSTMSSGDIEPSESVSRPGVGRT
jgi:hypothetical protein